MIVRGGAHSGGVPREAVLREVVREAASPAAASTAASTVRFLYDDTEATGRGDAGADQVLA